MERETLEKLYTEELSSLCDAERQQAQALPDLASRSGATPLSKLLNEHAAETAAHAQLLEGLLAGLDTACVVMCEPMREMLDAAARLEAGSAAGPGGAGAVLLGAARVEQYEIGAYFNLLTIARLLGRTAEIRLFREVLEQEGRARRRLERLMDQLFAPTSHEPANAPAHRAELAPALCLFVADAAPVRPGCDGARQRRARGWPLSRWGRRLPASRGAGW